MLLEKMLKHLVKARGTRSMRLRPAEGYDFSGDLNNVRVLYVHIPLCQNLCSFCSFHRFEYDRDTARRYFAALRKELALYHELGLEFDDIYFGGGTPTVDMDELHQTISFIRDKFPVKKISVEANPADLSEHGIAELKAMGINRLSVGVQSFNATILGKMERQECIGSSEEMKDRLLAARTEFSVLNVDMMFNIEGQTLSMLHDDIDSLFELGIDQITYYPLMNAHGGNGNSSPWTKADYCQEKHLYYEIYQRLSKQMDAQTIWCFSKKTDMIDEYIVSSGAYFGVGCGSFGYLDGQLFANTFSLDKYIDEVSRGKLPLSFVNSFTMKEQMRYDLLMQLFRRNIDIRKYNEKYKGDFGRLLWRDLQFLKHIKAIRMAGDQAHLTEKGMYYWLVMMSEFFKVVCAFRKQCQLMS